MPLFPKDLFLAILTPLKSINQPKGDYAILAMALLAVLCLPLKSINQPKGDYDQFDCLPMGKNYYNPQKY